MSLAILARLFCCVGASIIEKRDSSGRLFPDARFALAAIACAALCAIAIAPGARAAAQAGRMVTDEVGRRVVIPAEVNRVVTLAPNLTETVYALGLADKLVGDTNLCDVPPAAKEKPHVGDPQNPSLEAVVALRPDLVLATTSINREETADALARIGIAVYTTDSHTVRGTLNSIARIANVMGAADKGSALVERLQTRLDALHARLADQPMAHVLFVVWEDPLITIGQNTFIADALRWAGAESVLISDRNWPQISLEEVVRLQPDYIVFASGHGGSGASELADLRSKPTWRDLDAVEQGHVVDVSEEALRPAPGLVDAIEQLAHQLHPDAFSQTNEIGNTEFDARFAFAIAREAAWECDSCGR